MITNCKECVYFNGECKYDKVFDKKPYIDGNRCMNRHGKFPFREFVLRETRHYLTEILEIADIPEERIAKVSSEAYLSIGMILDTDKLHEHIEEIYYTLIDEEGEDNDD